MAPILNSVKNASRAAVVALALGGSLAAAMPAQAQSPGGPAMTFQLDLGNGNGGGFDGGPRGQGRVIVPDQGFGQGPGWNHRPGGGRDRFCLDDRQIRRGISWQGFDDVRIRRDLGRSRVEVTGVYGRWLYSMRVDRCSGYVDRVQPVRPARGGGFGFQFDFGN